MGNSSTKEARGNAAREGRDSGARSPLDGLNEHLATRATRSNSGRPDLGLWGIGLGPGPGGTGADPSASGSDDPALAPRRETKPEREARRAERERVARAKERERSIREEHVDGGYLVTLGTYVGPEDFSKATVRRLQIERRLAPFWRGLNEHSTSWTEHQLVAAARGKPIPPPDQIPSPSDSSSPTEPAGGTTQTPSSAIPIASTQSDAATLPQQASTLPAHMASPPRGSYGTASPLFRNRARTLASLASTKSNNSSSDNISPEIQLPKEPQINGQPVEAYLYKDVLDCPICFLSYPPYLNQTRCCDQPICSECFVQIKRPDPHPPEHVDPNAPPETQPKPWEEEGQLVSEVACCPFCVTPEFGITYDPPPFRRGLAYANVERSTLPISGASDAAGHAHGLAGASERGTPSPAPSGRRRTESLSANAPSVITTDMVRPDWAEKLGEARAHAARRADAATALHTAAYLMGGSGGAFPGLGRRRRIVVTDANTSAARPEGLDLVSMNNLLAALENQDGSRGRRRGTGSGSGAMDLLPGRVSSRAQTGSGGPLSQRPEDLEELMMMEAIRQSIAAEEERKRKEEREAAKEAKKEDKKKAKEAKKADKAARKRGMSSGGNSAADSVVNSSANASGVFNLTATTGPGEASTSGAGAAASATGPGGIAGASTGTDAFGSTGTGTGTSVSDRLDDGNKGKAKAAGSGDALDSNVGALLGWNPMAEPTSVLNDESAPGKAGVATTTTSTSTTATNNTAATTTLGGAEGREDGFR